MKRFAIVAAVACGSKAPPAAPPATPAPDAAAVAVEEPLEEGCERSAPVAVQLGGAGGTIELVTCTTREEPASATEGLTVKYREARLVFRKPRGDVRLSIGSWTDGWEWGQSMDLAGVLAGPRGEGVVFVSSRSAGPGDSRMSLSAYALQKDELLEVWSLQASSLDIALKGNELQVSGCEPSTAQTDTCNDGPLGASSMFPQKPIARRRLTWDGTAIQER